MQVFVSRIRREYVRKHSIRTMVAINVAVFAIMSLLGFAAKQDELDQTLAEQFTPALRRGIVARWTAVPVHLNKEAFPQGDGTAPPR